MFFVFYAYPGNYIHEILTVKVDHNIVETFVIGLCTEKKSGPSKRLGIVTVNQVQGFFNYHFFSLYGPLDPAMFICNDERMQGMYRFSLEKGREHPVIDPVSRITHQSCENLFYLFDSPVFIPVCPVIESSFKI